MHLRVGKKTTVDYSHSYLQYGNSKLPCIRQGIILKIDAYCIQVSYYYCTKKMSIILKSFMATEPATFVLFLN